MKVYSTSALLISASVLATASAREHVLPTDAFVLDKDISYLRLNNKPAFNKREIPGSNLLFARELMGRDSRRFDFNSIADMPFFKGLDGDKKDPSSVQKIWSSVSSMAGKVTVTLEKMFGEAMDEVEIVWTDAFGAKEKANKEPSKEEDTELRIQIEPELTRIDQVVFSSPKKEETPNENSDLGSDSDSDSDSDDSDEEEGIKELPTSGPTLLKTALNSHASISHFSRYIREFKGLTSRLDDGNKFTVVFAPSNEAIEAMEKKPWEFPIDPESVALHDHDHDHKGFKHYPEGEGDKTQEELDLIREKKMQKIIESNIKGFVNAHIVSIGCKKAKGNGRFYAGKVVESRSGSTIVVTLQGTVGGDEDSQYVHAVDIDGKLHNVRVVKQIEAQNGLIYVIENSLVNP